MSDIAFLPKEYALVIFGRLAQNCLEETEDENNLLEGLSPDRILLNNNWTTNLKDIHIKVSKAPFTAYAYYPDEYLQGKKWDTTCSVFALFAITYRLMTGELPYVGNVPEELLTSEEGLKFIVKRRSESSGLNVSNIPPVFRDFFIKGLALNKKDRYQAIGDTAYDYDKLTDASYKDNGEEGLTSSDDLNDLTPDYYGIFPRNNSMEFKLDVHTAEEGGLDDLAGLHEQKRYFREHFLSIIQNPEKAKKYKIFIPNGCLFYGPPGCGKTAFAKKCAAEAKINYAIVNAQDIASTLVHGTQMLVKQMFKQAAQLAPIMLILDEIETMVPNRNNPDNVKVAEETNAFLSELNDCGRRGIFVIGTTNRPQVMDSAILRSGRFDKKIYFPLPDEQTRHEIFKAYLRDRPLGNHIDYSILSSLTSDGYVSSDIRLICDEVTIKAFNEDTIITQSMIEQVIHDGSPSVGRNELRSYEETRKHMEPAAKYAPYINQIGFR